jgi:hypothetical protein
VGTENAANAGSTVLVTVLGCEFHLRVIASDDPL